MISRSDVIAAIDAAEETFSWCFAFLRDADGIAHDRPNLYAFQSKLTHALFKLNQAYRAIRAERNLLISRKVRYKEAWFRARMAQLDQYAKAVTFAIGNGRELGDGFAWLFYRDETALLEEHTRHQRQLLLPPNVGGLGERTFIDRMQGFAGTFILYHAITSFLRLGDFSFFDPDSGRIETIAELKTRHIADDHYEFTLAFSFGRDSPLAERLRRTPEPTTSQPALGLDSVTQHKLDRQVHQMTAALQKRDTQPGRSTLNAPGNFHYDALDKVIRSSTPRAMVFGKAGNGLLLAAWRPRPQKSLGKRMMRNAASLTKPMDPLRTQVENIMSSDFEDNCLFVGSLGNTENGFPTMLHGAIPLVWWPVENAELRDLLFHHVHVTTVFNPAHLWNRMRSKGFTVTIGDRSRVREVTRRINGNTLKIHHFQHFQQLVEYTLMDDGAVADLLDAFVQQATAVANQKPIRIGLHTRLTL
ncbi:hypothetical protein [Rhizobium sp. BK376]|uniref:hypothetical protein n=1 Tax=Rhizobium sp. BK376 TaxID=2512149 RepID=UPI0010458CCF|nr:hypothetical protein [Rhizobium sp. BK376]TCR80797.1 hypothetical protein EV561_11374 [Rhizobium sp. BK376]